MKQIINRLLACAVISASISALQAQTSYSGYFSDGYMYRYEMNPALANEKSFFSLPALGNINAAVRSNIGVDNFIYNIDGRTTTFMNPKVAASEFLDGINDKNRIGEEMKLNVLSVGFKGIGGYNTISINAREQLNVILPGSLFELAKVGPENKTYDISDLSANAIAYGEVALGHSHKVNNQWRVGGTLKVLVGLGQVDAKFNKAQLTLGQDSYNALTNAEVNASVKGLKYGMEQKQRGPEGQQTMHSYVNDVDIDGAGPNGFGLALDLGAEFRLNDDWRFSASLLDLGFISWNETHQASTNGDREFQTDKYIFDFDDEAYHSFDNEVDRLTEGLANLYELSDNGDIGGRTATLGATLNLGAEYTLPSYTPLSFGLLSTTRINGQYSWNEERLSVNWKSKVFAATANVALGTYGASFGWLLNLHTTGFGLFVGMDHSLGKLTKEGIPLSGNGHFNMGINFPL